MFIRKIIITITLAILFITMIILLHKPEVTGINEDSFWLRKLNCHGCADIVFTGDSRVVSGVFPRVMEPYLPYIRIFNYAFDGLGYSREYLETVSNKIDQSSHHKAIILGINPRTLTTRVAMENYFTNSMRKNKAISAFLLDTFDPVLQILRSIKIRDVLYLFFPAKKKIYFYHHYFLDGSIARYKIPPKISESINGYREYFSENKVSAEMIADVIEYVKEWIQQGIKVYALSIPVPPEMLEVERLYSGFKKEEFITLFESAGGKWIYLQKTDYPSWDGSHLYPEAGESLSKELSQVLVSTLAEIE